MPCGEFRHTRTVFIPAGAIHILQLLLGAIDVPGGMRYKPPYPKALNSLPKPSGRRREIHPNTPMSGPHLGFPMSPDELLIDDDGRPQRIDKAFSWEAPIAAHGLMHMVISNAWAGDPYPIDTLFFYMANMAWNSSMNTSRVIEMLTDQDAETGTYKIPHIIYSDAFASEMVPYADLILPDTTYLERWDCISLLDRPICHADAAADAIRHPVVQPDRDVRPFQDVLLDLGARLGLAGMIDENSEPKYPGGYADYITNHQRRPGIGPLAGWRGAEGDQAGRGEPNPNQLDRYIENGGFWTYELPPEHRYYRFANRGYLDWAHEMGFVTTPDQIVMKIYSEAMQKFKLAAEGHGKVQPPDHLRERVRTFFDPLPIWYTPLEQAQQDEEAFPLHAITQRPMHMYHSWGSQNAWLRQITGSNRLYMSHGKGKGAWHRRRRLGLGHQSQWPDPGPSRSHGRCPGRHRLDLERHRQTCRCLEPGRRFVRDDAGLPAQPPHLGAVAGWAAHEQLRSPDRSGRLVRSSRSY